MSEKPNSQERRKSSNIEVRIPQVLSTNEEAETPAGQTGPDLETTQTTNEELHPVQETDVAQEEDERKIPEKPAENEETSNNIKPVVTETIGENDKEASAEGNTDTQQDANNLKAKQQTEDAKNQPNSSDEQKLEKSDALTQRNGAEVQQDIDDGTQDDKIISETPQKENNHSTGEHEANAGQIQEDEKVVDLSEKAPDRDPKNVEEKSLENKDQKPDNIDQDMQESFKDESGEQQEKIIEKAENISEADTETNTGTEERNDNDKKTSENEDKKDFDTTAGQEHQEESLPKPESENEKDDMKEEDAKSNIYVIKSDPVQNGNTKESDSTKKDDVQQVETDTKTTDLKNSQEQQNVKETPEKNLKQKEKMKIERIPTAEEESPKDKKSTANKAAKSNKVVQKETRKPSTPRSPKLRSLEAMQAALSTRKKSESGFVLSSQFEELEEESLPSRELPEGDESDAEPKQKLATTSVHFQSGQSTKDAETAYMTETPDRVFTPDGRESRGSRTYSPAYFDTGARRSPEGKERKPKQKEKRDPKKIKMLERLNLSKPPEKFVLKLRHLKQDPDPTNKAPLNPNIYYAEVPKEGGRVKTPFYMQVDIPDGALDGNVRLKFEKQEFDRMKLGLSENDTLCSYIVDLNMEPHSYCLRQNATVRMRILDKCINKYEDTIIITARHFKWTRIPTSIESKNVNGEKHYYAVTQSQIFGKFAVVNAKKMDRFVISTAGGLFKSTIIPEIRLHVDENHLSQLPTQMIEMTVNETKQDAVKRINQDILAVKGVEGRLVAASTEIEISKNLMTQTGKMKHGIRFPEKLTLVLPLPPLLPTKNTPQSRSVVIMQKHTNANYHSMNGHRYASTAYSKNSTHRWKNVTVTNRLAVDGVSFAQEETIPIKVSAPGKYMVLVFENDDMSPQDDDVEPDFDLDDATNAVIDSNQEYEANIMIHQKVSQPSIIFIHMVTSDAIQPIHDTMRATNTWKQLYVSRQLLMHEWQPIKIEFKGDLQLTINQMTPQIRFFSKRWQGYQFQLEATDEAFATDLEKFIGKISFVEQTDETIQTTKSTIGVGDENETLCTVDVEIERAHAKPYKPTVVKKVIPKATIYREYKMKWLKDLSEEEIERYRITHGV